MTKTMFVAAMFACVALTAPAFAAMDEASCKALYAKADMNKDGSLMGDEDDAYNKAMADGASKPKTDQALSMNDFMAACEKGKFDNMAMQQ